MFAWKDVISAAMSLESQNALGQAGLLIGAERVVRVTPSLDRQMALDDWTRAASELPAAAQGGSTETGHAWHRCSSPRRQLAGVLLLMPTRPFEAGWTGALVADGTEPER